MFITVAIKTNSVVLEMIVTRASSTLGEKRRVEPLSKAPEWETAQMNAS